MTGDGGLVEVQATAERTPLSRAHLDDLLALAADGIDVAAGAAGAGGRRSGGLSGAGSRLAGALDPKPAQAAGVRPAAGAGGLVGRAAARGRRAAARGRATRSRATRCPRRAPPRRRPVVPVIADDSGIEAAALDGAPGVRSARFAGEHATDQENLDLLRCTRAGRQRAALRLRAGLRRPRPRARADVRRVLHAARWRPSRAARAGSAMTPPSSPTRSGRAGRWPSSPTSRRTGSATAGRRCVSCSSWLGETPLTAAPAAARPSPSGEVDTGGDGDGERHLGVSVVAIDEQDRDRDETCQDGARSTRCGPVPRSRLWRPSATQRRRPTRDDQV